jgi:type II secretory pathway pseudopilin PulG
MPFTFARRRHDPESGYVLLAVIFLTVVLLISLAIAAPKIATEIQHDKDIETIHRGEQYKRAIQLYYRHFGAYPVTVDQLLNTNDMRFLRKRYTDPETGKDDWKPVLYGQAHVRPLGFFGQPLSGIGAVGSAPVAIGMSTGMYAIAATTTTDENGLPVAGDSSFGGGAGSGPGMSGGSDDGGFGSGSGFGSPSGSGPSSSGLGQPSSSFGTSGTGLSGLQSNGSTPGGSSGFGSSNSTTAGGLSGSTFGGGGPIVGVTLPVNKPSLVNYKLQTRYNKWEFNYDPVEDQMLQSAGLFGGASPSAGPGGNSSGLGGANSGLGGTTSGLGGTNPGTGGTGSSGGNMQFGPNGNLGNPDNPNNQSGNPNGSGETNTPQQ